MEKWTQEKMGEVSKEIVQRATTDAEFRAKLLKDPAQVIGEVAGIPVPAEYKIRIVEVDPAYQATFMLPPMQPTAVDDASLDAVAGGACALDSPCGAKSDPCAVQGLCGAQAKK